MLECREFWRAFRSARRPHCLPLHAYIAHACIGRFVRDFSPLAQSVGAPPTFCTSDKSECGRLRAGSLEHSGVYQSRATVRRLYRSKRAGRRGESLDFRKLPRRVPVTRLRHGASARAQLGSLVAVAFRICSSFTHFSVSAASALPTLTCVHCARMYR